MWITRADNTNLNSFKVRGRVTKACVDQIREASLSYGNPRYNIVESGENDRWTTCIDFTVNSKTSFDNLRPPTESIRPSSGDARLPRSDITRRGDQSGANVLVADVLIVLQYQLSSSRKESEVP